MCTCIISPDDAALTAVVGNGNLVTPYSIDPTVIPTPRPLGHISRQEGDAALLIPQGVLTQISFTKNLLIRGGISADGGMAGTANRLTATVAGKYLMGGTFIWDGVLAGGADPRRLLQLSMGVAGTIWASHSETIIFDNPNQPDQAITAMSLIQMAVNDYIEMFVETSLTSEDSIAGASADLWAVWMGP